MLKLKFHKVSLINSFREKKNLKIFFLSFLLLSASCCTTDPQLEPDLKLELADISCTEAWLQLSTTNIQIPNNISLLINGSVKKTFNLNTQDTLLYIDSLLPNQSYSFQVSSIQNPVSSNKVQAQTMDTTSHNFTWQTIEFGVLTNVSRLFDVAIINENNIWAVGEIYMNDSLGQSIRYNAVHWGGQAWELKRIYYYGACSAVTYPSLKAIWGFNTNDIVITNGGSIGWFNGETVNLDCGVNPLLTGAINKIWGSSSSDLYTVSSNGNIAHYGGPSDGWKKIESGTNLILSDIAVNNLGEIHICGLNIATVDGIIIKSNNGTNFNTLVEGDNIPESQLFNPKLYGTIASISFDQSNTLYAAGNLVYQYKFNIWSYLRSLPENYIGGNPGTFYRGFVNKIRAKASNDIWIVGDRNTLRHFNGESWQQIGMPYDPQVDLVWRGMETKNNITVVVGSHDNNAIIMIIR